MADLGDRFDARADDVSGKAKEAAGKLTGDEHLEAQGNKDQAKADMKDAVADVKDHASSAADKVKDAFHKH